MVLEVNRNSWVKSAVANIYKGYYGTILLNNLDIKHFEHQKRDEFIAKLRTENIIGWFSSLEDKVDLEICLFPNKQELDQLIELERVIDKDVYPSGQFYTHTDERLIDSPYGDYKKMVAAWTKDDIKQGMAEEQARHYHLNLRTKLKI